MKVLRAIVLGTALLALCAAAATAQEKPATALPRAGAAFPEFTLSDVGGKPVSLGEMRGKAILLSFWSCYTDTCFTSVRVIEELIKKYGAQGLVAPTVCAEVPGALETNNYAGLLQRCGTGQVVLVDKDKALTKRLGITEFPTTFLIDRNHVVWKVITGIRPIMDEEFQQLVGSLVTE
jgi:peroxiredoxin